ncbi:hypothetical protein CEV34_4364 [Brucella pseudogrignonensis]|uniref:Uncharacterized protein n=1 Tax=Brucella pseudogrignonensis TaxID=419475 RepID=A0A256G5Z5_9HYPH|nr:hypothetical protein CEV34_4364 [Brucella pseudogrignonensis]
MQRLNVLAQNRAAGYGVDGPIWPLTTLFGRVSATGQALLVKWQQIA